MGGALPPYRECVKTRLLLAAFVALVAIALAGCGGSSDDDPTSTTTESSNGSAGTDDSSNTSSSGETAGVDLGTFSIPSPPGGLSVTTNELDDLTAHLVTVPADQFDAVVAFYDDWTEASSDDYQRIVAQSGGVT